MNQNRVVSSLAYKFIERLLVKGIGLIISVILARMLAPEDFGLIAIITVFINLSQTIIQSGLNTALVQNKDVTEEDYSTVFYISLLLSVVMIVVLFVSAPFIGQYYNLNTLILPLRIYALALIFGAFNSVQIARMQRNMQFKSMMICTLIATIASGTLGVVLAYLHCGIWALIAYYMSNVIFTSFAMLLVEKWIPRKEFSVARAKVLFDYGWKMLVSALLCSLYNDLRSLIIGKRYSAEDLGYYNRGQQFPNIISTTIDNTIQSVMFPTLATAQDSKETVRKLMQKSMTTGALLVFPAMFGLAAVGEPFIRVLLTDKWIPCIVYLQLICFAEANIPISSSSLIAIKAIGRSDVYMKLEIIRRTVMIAILAGSLFCFNSVKAVAIGYVISAWVDVVIISVPVSKLIGYSLFDQIKDLWKIVLASVIMMGAVFTIGKLPLPMILSLIIQIMIGAIVYILACRTLRIDSYVFIKNTLFGMLKKQKG